jgi:hypothetical protein
MPLWMKASAVSAPLGGPRGQGPGRVVQRAEAFAEVGRVQGLGRVGLGSVLTEVIPSRRRMGWPRPRRGASTPLRGRFCNRSQLGSRLR